MARPTWIASVTICALIACEAGPRTETVNSPVLGQVTLTEPGRPHPAPGTLAVDSLDILLRVGGVRPDPDDEFYPQNGMMDAIELPDYRLVVLDRHRIWLFDSAGNLLLRTGSRGEGPGEFRNIDAACPASGNRLVVQDGANRRLTVIDLADGHVVRSIPRDKWRMAQGCRTDGRLLVSTIEPSSTGSGMARVIGLRDADSGDIDTVTVIESPHPGRTTGGAITIAAGRQGTLVSDPWGNVLASYDDLGQQDTLRRLVSWWADVRTQAEASGAVAAGSGQPEARPMPSGERLSAVAEWVEVGPNGEIWVWTPGENNDSTSTWTCISPDGVPGVSLVLPSRPASTSIRFLGVSHRGILLRKPDSTGAATIVVARAPAQCR